jgi:hypothetical protein
MQSLAGILTKPDLIDPGADSARDRWVRTIEGKEEHLQLGYYCVRLPNERERSRSLPEEARIVEDEFFSLNSPWQEMKDRTHLGIPAFLHSISNILVNLIMKT